MRRVIVIVAWCIILSCLPMSLYAQSYIYAIHYQTMIFESPSAKSTVLFELPQGTKLEFVEQEDEWIQVTYETKTGYVKSTQIVFSAPDWQRLSEEYNTNEQAMTKLQFKTWWEQTQNNIIDHPFYFEGTVEEAKETWTGKLVTKLTLQNGRLELQMNPQTDKDVALTLEKGKRIRVVGKVLSFVLVSDNVSLTVEYQALLP